MTYIFEYIQAELRLINKSFIKVWEENKDNRN